MDAAGDDTPGFVVALVEDGKTVLCWGGDEENGFVEWTDTVAKIRSAKRWRTFNGEMVADVISESEQDIELANSDIWQELMRKSHIEIEEAIRRKTAEQRKLKIRRR